MYTFASSITLQPNTAYYFYDSALSSSEWGNNANFSAIGAGYQGYGAGSGGQSLSYTTRGFAQAFDLTGTAATATPEPSTAYLILPGMIALALVARKRNGFGSPLRMKD